MGSSIACRSSVQTWKWGTRRSRASAYGSNERAKDCDPFIKPPALPGANPHPAFGGSLIFRADGRSHQIMNTVDTGNPVSARASSVHESGTLPALI